MQILAYHSLSPCFTLNTAENDNFKPFLLILGLQKHIV